MAVTTPTDTGPWSTPALVSYFLLAELLLAGLGVFLLIGFGVKVEAVMIGVLSAVLTTLFNAVAAVTGYWLASSAQSKATSAAMAQIAGAGPPPPADPLGGKSANT